MSDYAGNTDTNWSAPSKPQEYSLGTLNRGMILDMASTEIPPQACLTAENFIVGRAGPLRRPGTTYFNDEEVAYPPIQDLVSYWKLDGTQETLVLDSKFMYVATSGGFQGKYWTFQPDSGQNIVTTDVSGVVYTSGFGLQSSGFDLKVGDVLVIDPTGSSVEVPLARIDSDETAVGLSDVGVVYAGTNFEIRRAFGTFDGNGVDWAIYTNPDSASATRQVVFADGVRVLRAWDGTDFTEFGSNPDLYPVCLAGFSGSGRNDRLFIGKIQEDAFDWRQRIRWTTVTEPTRFKRGEGDDTDDFYDIPYTKGYVRRLIPLGGTLVAYFNSSVWIGRPTNRSDLPVVFDPIETGGQGLVGPKAICSWIDSHFFVMQGGIYRLSLSDGLSDIGAPILSETLHRTEYLGSVCVAPDPERERIVFGFPPSDSPQINRVWSYDYKTGAWSYDNRNCSVLINRSYSEIEIIDDITESIDSLTDRYFDDSAPSEDRLFFGYQGRLAFYSGDRNTDVDDQAITCVYTTKDFTFGQPNQMKTALRVSIKIDRFLDDDLAFAVEVSENRGRTWTNGGTLRISAGYDEGFVNFIVTGSTLRYRITSSSVTDAYRIMDFVVRVKGRSLEYHVGPFT